MSTWISRGTVLGLVACALASCASLIPGRAVESVPVAGGAVVVAGPPGYCVDSSASRPGGSRAFVLLGSCASISGDPEAPAPTVPAVLTASVVQAPPGGMADALDELEAFFETEEGRAALARDGQASSVEVLGRERRGDALYLRVRDASAESMPGTAETYWRGLFGLNGQLVTLAVISFSAQPLSRPAGLATLEAFEDRLRDASARALAEADVDEG